MNRKLSFNELCKLLKLHGCTVEFNSKTNKLRVYRGGEHSWSQHAHKGERDHFEKRVIHSARHALGLADMSDEDFYAPLD